MSRRWTDLGLLAFSCFGGVVVFSAFFVGACEWIGRRDLDRARRVAESGRVGMGVADVLAAAGSAADHVEVHEGSVGVRARRVVARVNRTMGGDYYVLFCLDPADRVMEVVPPAEYPDGCFLATEEDLHE